jgi:thiol:disulfide interchange protein
MATPCSAPFLGTAVSFALGQPAAATFAVFAAVGIGMALPYLLLAASPSSAKWLPKPGAWMETLKGVLGFLLAGAGIWLLYVLAAIVSPEALAVVEAGLLTLALGLWLRNRAGHKVVGTLLALLAAAGTIAVARPEAGERGPRLEAEADGAIVWIPFDEATAEQLAAEGRLVFVDVTADWCLTCKVNERLVLARDGVREAFEEHQVVAMKADWTRRDDTIAAYLTKHGRTGIPFYVLYRPGSPPHVFGEVLTVDSVVEAVRGRP